MDYKELGDKISIDDYNAIVYLLRKFKRLTSNLRIGENILRSDFGTYTLTEGFKSFGGNWILENDVTITSDDVLKNCYYSFIFTVIDVNLSGEVNRRLVTVDSESTGDEGTLEVTIPSDLIAENEVILTDFNVEVVFDEHEYYTPLPSVDFELTSSKEYVGAGDTCIIHGVLTQNGVPLPNKRVNLDIAGNVHALITDSHGEITYTYTGTGNAGKIDVQAFNEHIYFYDYESVTMTVRGSFIGLGDTNKCRSMNVDWAGARYPTLVDWGDGTSAKISTALQRIMYTAHRYEDGLSEHTVRLLGEVQELYYFLYNFITDRDVPFIKLNNSVKTLGWDCFIGTRLNEVILPNNLKTMMSGCFAYCKGLTSVSIPASVNSINGAFTNCTSVTNIQLWWKSNPVPYTNGTYREASNAIFTIPAGTTQLYIDAGYPAAKLVERPIEADTINITSTKDILSAHDSESATITATLSSEDITIPNTELDYTIVDKDDNLLDDGTVTTDANGEASIVYTATGVGDVTVTFSLHSLLQKTYNLEDCVRSDSTTYSSTTNTDFVLPSRFKIEYDFQYNGAQAIYMTIGQYSENVGGILTGKVMSTENTLNLIARKSNNGTGDIRITGTNNYPSNTWNHIIVTYDGTAMRINDDDVVLTNFNGVTMDKIRMLTFYKDSYSSGSGQIKNIKIKRL